MPVVINGSTGIATPDGSASVPPYTGASGSTNGLYFPTSTSAALATNGAVAVTIDSSQNVGIGTGSPTGKIQVTSSAGAGLLVGYNNTSVNYYDANTQIFRDGTFAEAMRITGGNVGIGTTSPAYKLDVSGTGNQVININTNTSGNPKLRLSAAGVNSGYVQYSRSNAALEISADDVSTFYSIDYTGLHRWYKASAGLTMTLDNVGNLGLGVTPSAWTRPAIQNGAAGSVSYFAATNIGVMTSNVFYDGVNKYISTNPAVQYSQGSGQHSWSVAASGTAGTAITFTQAMTLDASGRLGIGTTNPSGYTTNPNALVVNSTTATAYSASALQAASILTLYGGGGSGNATGTRISQGGSFELFFGGVQETGGAGAFVFQGYSGSAYTERMRIDSSGNLLVGTTSSSGKLTVNGTIGLKTGDVVIGKIETVKTISVSTTAVNIIDGFVYGGLAIVNGNSGAPQFADLVFWGYNGVPTVLSSQTIGGSPVARTYTAVNGVLKLAMASGTYTVAAVAITATNS